MVFIIACAGLAVFSPRPLLGPSDAPHYAHLAQSWLQGRLDLGRDPPGFPTAHNDWAKVTEIDDGSGVKMRAKRCVTKWCKSQPRASGTWWWVESESEPRAFTRAQRQKFTSRWYVSFPPGPAVLMLPLVALVGTDAPDILLTLLLAGIFATLLVHTLDEWRGRRAHLHLLLAAAWVFASPATIVGSQGGVWFTAQISASVCTMMAIRAWLRVGVGWRAGLWLALACTCRPHLGVVALVWLLARDVAAPTSEARPLRPRINFLVPLTVAAVTLAAHNWIRFGDPLEFGHRWLDVRWQERMQQIGLFSPSYLTRNLQCLVAVPFQFQAPWPWIKISIHGVGLALTAPWLVMVARRPPVEPRRACWRVMMLSASLVALLPLAYHNSGQIQVTYRFALDWMPFVIVGLAAANPRGGRILSGLVAIGIAVNLHLSWAFKTERPGLFVTKPLGWPFQEEFQRSTRRRLPPQPRPTRPSAP